MRSLRALREHPGIAEKTITYRDMLVKVPEIASLVLRGTK